MQETLEILRARRIGERDQAREQIQIWRDNAMAAEGAIAALEEAIAQLRQEGESPPEAEA